MQSVLRMSSLLKAISNGSHSDVNICEEDSVVVSVIEFEALRELDRTSASIQSVLLNFRKKKEKLSANDDNYDKVVFFVRYQRTFSRSVYVWK